MNRENIPPAISDTGFLSATRGTYDMMIRMIFHYRWKHSSGGGVMYFVCVGAQKVYVCVCSKKK